MSGKLTTTKTYGNSDDSAVDQAGAGDGNAPPGAYAQLPDASSQIAPLTAAAGAAATGWSPSEFISSAASAGSGGGSTIISTTGSGLVFNNTYDASCTTTYINCIVAAERLLENLFTNAVTINLTFKEANNGNNGIALGNSWSSWTTVSYATLKGALPATDTLPSTDPNPAGGSDWYLPVAYARMLGLTSSAPSTDDTITLNSYYNWSYGQDVINGIMHELSEGGMGRVGGLGDQNGVWSTMDLFRYAGKGAPDYTDGRDGKTTYFSSDGGITLSTLTFNNQYVPGNPNPVQVNTGDPADWSQTAVFGSTYTGETLTLAQTELNLMAALGWHTALPQDEFAASSDDWQTIADWTIGSMPITPEDAFIGYNSTATSNASVTVNSIGGRSGSSLVIASSSSFTATNGTVLNSATTSSYGSGSAGSIIVTPYSSLTIGNAFYNSGSLYIGEIQGAAVAGYEGTGYLYLNGTVTLNGGGTLYLGKQPSSNAYSSGYISGGGLVNVNDSIGGGGTISLTSLDNQAGGYIEAIQAGVGSPLRVSASTFTNEGELVAWTGAEFILGQSGATQALANTGQVVVGGDLALSGNYTISGSGSITFKGAGAEITSDGSGPTTFTNQSTINPGYSGQIGDVGILGVNDLTFNNTGTVLASGSGVSLTINTGGNTIGDGGGLLEAASGGVLVIDSNVDTGEASGPGGTIEAASGGTVILSAAAANVAAAPVTGQIVIAGGTFEMGAGASVSVPIEFTSTGGTLKADGASVSIGGPISGFALGDYLDLPGVFFAAGEQMVFQSISNGVQTYALEDASSNVLATLSFSGHYSGGLFQIQQDSAGGSIISLVTPPAPAPSDYDPNGVSDLIWQSQANGDVYEWQMSGGQHTGNIYLNNGSGWSDVASGHFYGSGAAAGVLWESQTTGGLYEWQMSGGQHVANVYLGNLSGWSEAGVGGFYGDGTDDLLWQNQTTGDVYEWRMSNGQHTGNDVYLGNLSGWSETGVGHFYGGGTDDLLWRNQSTGDVYEWTMINGQHTGNDIYLGNLSGWSEVGVGDFFGNGTSDLLWQNQTTGDVYEWRMSNGQHTGNDIYLGNAAGYSVVAVGDHTGSGVSDIVWQSQATGDVYEWTMANGQHTGNISLGNASGWLGK